jgi:hypothetical protein
VSSTTAAVPTEHPEPPFPSAVVEEMLKLFLKAVRAHQLYLHNNPTYVRALEAARGAFAPVWEHTDEISLVVTETELRWESVPVLTEGEKASDSLPWILFKDGVRELRLQNGFEHSEMVALLDMIQRVRKGSPDEDDLLTMFWEQEFLYMRYRYVDVGGEGGSPLEVVSSEDRPRVIEQGAREELVETANNAIVNIADFDSTLYFLDEKEVAYMHSEVQKEYERDLRSNVIAAMLDIYENQADLSVRSEITEQLNHMVVHLLASAQFRPVAYLLREVAQIMQRAKDLSLAQRNAMGAIPDQISEPASLAQLIQSLDEAADLPAQEDLTALFEELRPSSLVTVFSWLVKVQNVRLRTLLETAASRLASANTTELVKLIAAHDASVAIEAMRRAGSLRTAAAVPPLAKVMTDGDAAMRLAGAQALAEIGSPGALQVLERAIDDVDRDVRVATARAIAARTYRPALPRVEAAVKGKDVRDADLTEKMAIFEAYGALCGEAGVPLLDGILNAKGFLARRDDPEVRACAAMALGRIGSEAAIAALRRAAGEKEAIVRNAINRALRGGPA